MVTSLKLAGPLDHDAMARLTGLGMAIAVKTILPAGHFRLIPIGRITPQTPWIL